MDNWKAEMDANTLAEAKVITNDPQRLRQAQDAAARLATEQTERARAMNSVAKNPGVKVPTEKTALPFQLNGSYS